MNGAVPPRASASSVPPRRLEPELCDADFELFRVHFREQLGIALSPLKKQLVAGRLLSRLKQTGTTSYREYFRAALGDSAEHQRMLDAICTNETSFFREPWQFEFLRDVAIPRWEGEAAIGRRERAVRVWSAGCSTGEEPYSVAIALREALDPAWRIEILATDVSHKALERARTATWPIAKTKTMSESTLRRSMLRGTGPQEGNVRVVPELRGLVRFAAVNLFRDELSELGTFDLVLCRNVLIYFDAASRAVVVDKLLRAMTRRGFLFMGHAESLHAVTDRVRPVAPAIYVLQ